ncbi:hypothetical protein [Kribbella ginsengisoli]|uniref:CsbD family protein n=1 Tax=Kribbella ginsengisoli TaxID=363865 RepID=A0ABP6XWP2_9ACTN
MSDDDAASRAEAAARRAEEAARQAKELAEAAREEARRNQEIRDAGRGGDGDQPGKTQG